MSAPPPATEDPVEDVEYIAEEYDDDDDDEDDFVPGQEEIEDDDDDDDTSDVVPLLDGHLFYGAKHALHYQGEGFHLSASEAAPWNLLDSSSSSLPSPTAECELIMSGPCDFETAGAKATPRTMKVTFSVGEPPSHDGGSPYHQHQNGNKRGRKKSTNGTTTIAAAAAASSNKDDNDDSKAPALYYRVFGSQIDSHSGGDLMEFMGGFHPPAAAVSSDKAKSDGVVVEEGERVGLVCQVRMIPASNPPTAAAAAAASPVAAKAARIDDDEDDEEQDVDEDLDYNELIALHEDAGMSVADLKKRYHDGSNNKRTTRGTNKRFKSAPPPPEEEDDFEGF